jgi:hypothetical protein
MRGAQGLALAGVILQEIFEHNQDEFTKAEPRTIPTIAVIEEAQTVMTDRVSSGEGPFVAWVKEGRKYDLGAVLVTQQPGSLPSELLSQGDNWFIFHLLSAGDLRALKSANAHFSDDLLSSLLNEPLVGHGLFWSSSGGTPYPIPIRALSFEATYLAADPTYDRDAPDHYAAQLRGRFQAALDRAVEQAGGATTIGGEVDATETIKAAAIEALRANDDFQSRVRLDRGLAWAEVQSLLADALPDTIPDARQWVYDQQLVVRALDEVLGQGGWSTERRPRRNDPNGTASWIVAAPQALPRDAPRALRPDERLFEDGIT